MQFTELPIVGAYVIDLEPHLDERGFFGRTFCRREFESHGLSSTIAQCSTSFNLRRGTIRGLHYQAAPHEEVKVVRCTAGGIYDVIVDLRAASPTFGTWYGASLTADNHRMIYIPPGVAHGFQTTENNSEIFYQISTDYVPDAARGIRWDDPHLAIDWPYPEDRIISQRDAAFPMLSD